MHCSICDQENESVTISTGLDNHDCCNKCNAAIQKNLEGLERRAMAKEKRLMLYHNEVTGEYSLDDISEEDLLGFSFDDDDVDRYLDGFHFVGDGNEDEN